MGKRNQKIFIAICTVPTVLLTAIFLIVPTIRALSMSFYNVTGISSASDFVLFENYRYMLAADGDFYMALRNTVVLMLTVPMCTLILSLVFAFFLTQGKMGANAPWEKGFYRTVFFFPSVLSLTMVAILWSFIYHPSMGVVNTFLEAIGLGAWARPWLGDGKTVLGAIAVTLVWQAVGYYMVMYMAGIDGIPQELYEAATIDGAGAFQKLMAITIPMLWEVIRVTIIFAIGGAINLSFVIVSIMTNGGPGRSSTVLLQYMYMQGFQNSNFGYAMAIAVFTLLMAFVLSYLSNRLTEKEA